MGLAREYLEVREQFAAGSPLRMKLDAALKDYFSASQEVGDRSVVAAQMEILAAGDKLMHEFPIDQGELFRKFYPIWAWASHDVAERQSIAQEEVDVNENVWASRAAALLERLEKECKRSLTGWLWSAALLVRLAVLGIVGTTLFIIALAVPPWVGSMLGFPLDLDDGNVTTVAVLGSLLGIGASLWLVGNHLKPILDQKIWFPLNGKFALRCYRDSWRRELMDFQRRSHVPDQFFRALFAHFAEKSATSTWVNEFVQQDYAPALLAGAQRYEA